VGWDSLDRVGVDQGGDEFAARCGELGAGQD